MKCNNWNNISFFFNQKWLSRCWLIQSIRHILLCRYMRALGQTAWKSWKVFAVFLCKTCGSPVSWRFLAKYYSRVESHHVLQILPSFPQLFAQSCPAPPPLCVHQTPGPVGKTVRIYWRREETPIPADKKTLIRKTFAANRTSFVLGGGALQERRYKYTLF